jgi:uncharacterized membrane protein
MNPYLAKALQRPRLRVFVIAVLGGLLRLVNVSETSLWVDETTSILFAESSLPHLIAQTATDVHPPFYYVFLHFWIDVFGVSELSVRLPSVLFALVSILLVYEVGATLFSETAGVLSAFLLSISVVHLKYSQVARMYTLLVLLTLVSYLALLRIARRERGQNLADGVSVVYLLSSVLLLYTHVYGLFVLAAQNAYVLTVGVFSRRESIGLKRWAGLQSLIGVLYLPWIYVIFQQFQTYSSRTEYATPSVFRLITPVIDFSNALPLVVIFVVFGVLSLIRLRRTRGELEVRSFFSSLEECQWTLSLQKVKQNYLLILWIGFPVVLTFVVAFISAPNYATRYTLAALPAFLVLFAGGFTGVETRRVQVGVLVLVLIFSGLSMGLFFSHDQPLGEQWDETAGYIETNSTPGDVILIDEAKPSTVRSFSYYFERDDVPVRRFLTGTAQASANSKQNDRSRISRITEEHSRVWVVLSHIDDCDNHLVVMLNESFSVTRYRSFQGTAVYLFEADERPLQDSVPIDTPSSRVSSC